MYQQKQSIKKMMVFQRGTPGQEPSIPLQWWYHLDFYSKIELMKVNSILIVDFKVIMDHLQYSPCYRFSDQLLKCYCFVQNTIWLLFCGRVWLNRLMQWKDYKFSNLCPDESCCWEVSKISPLRMLLALFISGPLMYTDTSPVVPLQTTPT